LREIKKRLDRVGRVKRIRLEAGLPDSEKSFVYDAEHGRARFVFAFKEWWPDEGRIPRNQLGELNRAAREFWFDFFAGQKKQYPEKDWGFLFERAKHELLWFNRYLVPDKKHGGARFDPGRDPKTGKRHRSNLDIWWSNWWVRRDVEELREITLQHPFRSDADWSIEISVSWDVDIDGKRVEPVTPADLGLLTPGYFVLAAGEFQAGVIAAPQDFGGGNGGRLFQAADIERGFEKRMNEFHWRTFTEHRRKFPPKGDRAYFDQYTGENVGVLYRMRLEKKGNKIRFFAATLEDWNKRRFDEKRDFFLQMSAPSKNTLERAMRVRGNRVFRIFSLNPCRLHEVVMEGQLPK
jgi:hypothetical protein